MASCKAREFWKNRRSSLIRTTALTLLLASASPALAQPGYQPARTPDGHPDFQGVWTNSSITLLERGNPSLPLGRIDIHVAHCIAQARWMKARKRTALRS
jgi:hypothetical protein